MLNFNKKIIYWLGLLVTSMIAGIIVFSPLFVTPPLTKINYTPLISTDSYESVSPLYPASDLNPEVVAIGKTLFSDQRLSKRKITCASCHILESGGDDNNKKSISLLGGVDVMNTPTIYNVGYQFRLQHRGDAFNLTEQLNSVINDPKHMDTNWDFILNSLGKDKNLVNKFKEIFPENGLSVASISYAITSYERSLVTLNSRFDQYLKGNKSILTGTEKKGWALFNSYGCISCHEGPALGGTLFARLGIFKKYFTADKPQTTFDQGRYTITNNKEDRYVFKVPSLRNIKETAPYLHNGSIEKLDDMVKIMIEYQLGRKPPIDDVKHIVDFLGTLTGHFPEAGFGE